MARRSAGTARGEREISVFHLKPEGIFNFEDNFNLEDKFKPDSM
jgi:hypothetical protein